MTDTDVQTAAAKFTKRLIKEYTGMIDAAYKIAATNDEFGDMQREIFEAFRDMLISKCRFPKLAASNFCRLLIHLYQPNDSPFSAKDLRTMENIIKNELRKA
jgi:hypothetical protein